MNCKNCNHLLNANFCSHCGQSAKVGKINFSNFASELSGSIFQINRGLFYTMKQLFVRPGHSIKEYLNGKRKNHFKPIAYVFTLSTIYFLLSQYLESETFVNDAISGYTSGALDKDLSARHKEVLNWIGEHYAYTMLVLLPLYALGSYLAFFKTGFNYLEHCVFNAYVLGQQSIIYAIAAILGLVIDHTDFLSTLSLLLSMAYFYIVCRQFFSEQSRVGVFLRWFLTYFLYLIMLVLLTGLVAYITS